MVLMVFKNEIVSHFLVTFVYFLLVCVLRWDWKIWGLLEIWGGAMLGTFFLDIDHLLYWFVVHPEKEDAKEARGVWSLGNLGVAKKVKKLYGLLKKVHFAHNRLIFHSVVGQAILLILAFYLITSGGSIFGSAFILSINLHLLKDEWQDYFCSKIHLIDWLFWQIKGVVTEKQLTIYLIVVSLVFLVMTRLLI